MELLFLCTEGSWRAGMAAMLANRIARLNQLNITAKSVGGFFANSLPACGATPPEAFHFDAPLQQLLSATEHTLPPACSLLNLQQADRIITMNRKQAMELETCLQEAGQGALLKKCRYFDPPIPTPWAEPKAKLVIAHQMARQLTALLEEKTGVAPLVRDALLPDAEALAELEALCFDHGTSAEGYALSLLKPNRFVFTADFHPKPDPQKDAELCSQAAGLLVLSGVADEVSLDTVCVTPFLRGKGLGERLLRAALLLAKAHGYGVMQLEVRPSNQAARRLYAKQGFEEVGRRKGYYNNPMEDALLMDLKL